MKTEHNGFTLVEKPNRRYNLYKKEDFVVSLRKEHLGAIHILSGGCPDDTCPCYQAGREHALEEPRRPAWA